MATVWRGVNDAGGEFAPTVTPGVQDTHYHYDSAQTFAYIAGRGHKLVRLPFLWERVQPTRGAALDATLLANFKAYVKRATDAGLKVLLDMHNYARRHEGGVEKIMGTDFPASDLVDVWTRLSTEFKADANVIGYGIMNEPHGLSGLSTTTGAELVGNPGFETNLTGWAASNSTIVRDTAVFRTGAASMKVTSTGATDGRASFGGIAVAAGATYAVGYDARGDATSAGRNTFIGIDWFTSANGYLTSTFVDYFGLADGSWKRHLVQVTAPAGAAKASLIPGFQATAANQVMWVDDVTWKAGTVTTGAKRWEQASQDVVTAIRNNADTTPIFVPGYDWSSAKNWPTTHPEPWISDTAAATVYEGHFYFDRDNSGRYVNTYADENADAVARGYVDLKARALDELDNFTAWLAAKGVKGFVGEIGWPNTGDTAGWNAVGDTLYTHLDQQKVGATYWSAGEWWHSTYLLSIYTGTPHSTATSIAATVEAHPTTSDTLTASAALGGNGTLSAATAPALAGAAALSSAGTLSATPAAARTGGAALASAGTLTAGAAPAHVLAATVTSTGTLAASTKPAATQTASLGGTGALTAPAAPAVAQAAALSGTGTLTAGSTPAATTGAAITSGGALSAGAAPAATAAAALGGGGSLSTSSSPAVAQAASLSGAGTLSASTGGEVTTGATLAGTGALTAGGTPATAGAAALGGDGGLSAGSTPAAGRPAALGGAGILATVTAASLSAAANLASAGTLAALTAPTVGNAAGVGGNGTLTAGTANTPSTAGNLGAAGQLTAAGTPSLTTGASLGGGGSLAAVATTAGAGRDITIRTGPARARTLHAGPATTRLVAAAPGRARTLHAHPARS